MGVFGGIIAILGMKPVANLLNKLTGKLFGGKNSVDKKVVAVGAVALWVASAIGVANYFDPGLAAILTEDKETLIAFVGTIQIVVAYYTRDELNRG